jgi:hypothetical protein
MADLPQVSKLFGTTDIGDLIGSTWEDIEAERVIRRRATRSSDSAID